MVVGCQEIHQAGVDHLPGQLLRARTRALVVAGETAHVDLQQGSHLLPRVHHVEGLVPRQIPVSFRMSDHNVPAGIRRLSHHIIVVALQVEAELYQQRSAGKSHTISAYHSPMR